MRDFINYDLGVPPRIISFITSIRVLWGGIGIHIGAFIFWLGMVVTFQQVMNSEFKHIGATWGETDGVLMKYREGEIELDDYNMVYEYIIGYQVNGESYSAICYGGKTNPSRFEPQTGVFVPKEIYSPNTDIDKKVRIEYKKSDHQVARIKYKGMLVEPYSSSVGFMLLIPLIGVLIMLFYYIKNKKIYYLLKEGIATRGTLASSTSTNVSINEQEVYKYDFVFTANQKTYKATGKTHHYSRVENEEEELILYSKKNPKKAIIYDIYPYLPTISTDGRIVQSSFVEIVPITIIHGIGFLITYMF